VVYTSKDDLKAKRQEEGVYANAQEAYQKYTERAFGLLQARFVIVRGPAHLVHEVRPKYYEGMCDSSQHDHLG
jgi:hypothetical protein